MLYSDLTLFTLLTGVIVPFLVGVLTKLNAPSSVKAVLNLGLTALGSVLATISEVDFNWKIFLVNWAIAWVVSVGTYYGFYKPTGVSDRAAEATADFGIG